jgi:hypothetical protein
MVHGHRIVSRGVKYRAIVTNSKLREMTRLFVDKPTGLVAQSGTKKPRGQAPIPIGPEQNVEVDVTRVFVWQTTARGSSKNDDTLDRPNRHLE